MVVLPCCKCTLSKKWVVNLQRNVNHKNLQVDPRAHSANLEIHTEPSRNLCTHGSDKLTRDLTTPELVHPSAPQRLSPVKAPTGFDCISPATSPWVPNSCRRVDPRKATSGRSGKLPEHCSGCRAHTLALTCRKCKSRTESGLQHSASFPSRTAGAAFCSSILSITIPPEHLVEDTAYTKDRLSNNTANNKTTKPSNMQALLQICKRKLVNALCDYFKQHVRTCSR